MSSPSTAQLILNASRLYSVCVSFIILFGGVFGHLANIFVFTRLKSFRGNPSVLYIILESIVDLLQMIVSFTLLIAINGFSDDLTQTSLAWCKLSQFFLQFFTLISLNIVCLAAIDQYLSTSYYPFLRQISTIKSAKVLTTIAIIAWTLHGIPFLIYFEIHSIFGCSVHNQNFLIYISYFYYLILSGVLPIIVSTFFGVLAYRNVRHLVRRQQAMRRRKLDQQLTAMIILRVLFLVTTILPYAVERSYTFSTLADDNLLERAIIQLIGAITFSLFYLNYAGSFYLFLISSTRFRRQVKCVFVNKVWRLYCRKTVRQNQIMPITLNPNSEYD